MMAHVSAMVADSSGMKNKVIVISTALLMLACGNKSREVEPVVYDGDTIVEQVVDTMPPPPPDSGRVDGHRPPPPPDGMRPDGPPPPPPHGKGRPPHKHDNMRGFDPASEDDMDDNGMSRYMENNDEEGWE